MKDLMGWEECSEGHIKLVEKDPEKIESLRMMCRARLKAILMIQLDDETASIIAVDYYEVIKELLVALLLKDGLKSDNHECLISYFRRQYPTLEYEATVIHQLKYYRNRASYEGVFIQKDYIERNKSEFDSIIRELLTLLEK